MLNSIRNNLLSEDSWFKFEVKLNNVEKNLSNISGCTVVLAPLAGPVKIIMGTVQVIAAGILGLSSFGAQLKGDAKLTQSLKKHSFEHIQHGFNNILAGVIESLPIISSIALLVRNLKGGTSSIGIGPETDKGIKFRPYESLEKRSMKLTAGTAEKEKPGKLQNANLFFFVAYPTNESRDKASLAQMKQDAALASRIAGINYPFMSLNSPYAPNPEAVVKQYNENRGYEAVCLNLNGKIVLTELASKKVDCGIW